VYAINVLWCYLMCYSVDDSFTILSEERNLTDGSTAVVAVIHDGQLVVGNAGDSRSVQTNCCI
jgi:serine/threonine protein phosphatase PrpC